MLFYIFIVSLFFSLKKELFSYRPVPAFIDVIRNNMDVAGVIRSDIEIRCVLKQKRIRDSQLRAVVFVNPVPVLGHFI